MRLDRVLAIRFQIKVATRILMRCLERCLSAPQLTLVPVRQSVRCGVKASKNLPRTRNSKRADYFEKPSADKSVGNPGTGTCSDVASLPHFVTVPYLRPTRPSRAFSSRARRFFALNFQFSTVDYKPSPLYWLVGDEEIRGGICAVDFNFFLEVPHPSRFL